MRVEFVPLSINVGWIRRYSKRFALVVITRGIKAKINSFVLYLSAKY